MKVLKFFIKFIFSLLLLLLIFWAIALVTLQTKSGQTWLLTHVIQYMEEQTQSQIQVGNVDFSFPLHLRFENISISQNNHPVLSIQELEICGHFPKLLQGRLVFSKFYISSIDIHALFDSVKSDDTKNLQPWDTLRLPFYVKLENIDIQKIKLNSHLIETLAFPPFINDILNRSSLNLQGMMSHNPFRGSITAHLLLSAKNHDSGISDYLLGIDAQNHQLSLSLHSQQFPLHAFKPELPSTLKTTLALYASASVQTWQNLVQHSLIEDSLIEGHFKLSLSSPLNEENFLSTLIGQHTSLRSGYLIKSKDAIELSDLVLENSSLFIQGKGILTADEKIYEGNFKGKCENLERFEAWLGKGVKGNIIFDGHAAGSLESPSILLHIESPHLSLSQKNFQNIHTTLQITPQNQGWKGFINLTLNYQDIPWKGSTFFDWNHQHDLTFNQLQIDAMQSHLEGQMRCNTSDYIWEGFLDARTQNLKSILDSWDFQINGEANLKLELTSLSDPYHQKKQGWHAHLIGKNLQGINWKAHQLIFDLGVDHLQESSEFLNLHSQLEGEDLYWQDYRIGEFKAYSKHGVQLAEQNLTHLSTQWSAKNIHWTEGQASQGSGQVDLNHPLQGIDGTFQLILQNIETSTAQVNHLAVHTTIQPTQTQWPFQIKGQGNLKENFEFIADGYWHLQSDGFEVQTNQLNGHLGPYPLYILQPVHFVQHTHGIQVADLHFKWGEAEIQADIHQEQKTIFSKIKTNAIPSELIYLISPKFPLIGRAAFEGYFEGPLDNPYGKFQIHLLDVQFTEDVFKQKPLITGSLDLELNQQGIQVKSELNGIGRTPLLISGTLPISSSLNPFQFKVNSQLPFDLTLNAEGELDPYLHLFYNDTTNLSGQTKIALKLSGQMSAPEIQGYIDLSNGVYESLSTGAIYHHIQGHLEGNGSQINLTQFSAQDKKGGFITATGSLALDTKNHFPFEFQIHPSHIFILDSDYAAISVSGPLSLKGNMKQSTLQGELTVNQATIRLEETLPRQIKTVDVKYINLAKGEKPPSYLEKKEKYSAIDLDINVQASQNVVIQGNHLKSDWKGSILVTGTPDYPQFHGDLRINQGEYDFNGKIFNLSQGNIHFGGALNKKTTLYIVASKDIDRIRADIIVKGSTNKPVISFRSNPPLSQREVLSYILFNRGISDITSDQGDQLSQSFISLNSSEQTKSSDDFLSRLRNNTGIDRLDFITNDKENKDIGLQVGKNLTENISVTVNQSMTSLSPIIAVEVKLRKNVKAQAEAGVIADAPVRMSLKWKKDY